MTFGGGFGRVFRPAFDPGLTALPWYRAGGAPLPVAVYQPKGAASLAASYVNLANPGTYDAAPGVAPTLDATGWTFNGINQWLRTGIIPANDQKWAVLACYSDAASMYHWIINGSQSAAGPWFGLEANRPDNAVLYGNGNLYFPSPALTSGVLAVAADKGYRNGVAESGTIGAKAGSFTELRIAAENYGGLPRFFNAITIQTIVIWETSTGHATWMPAVMAAAAAL